MAIEVNFEQYGPTIYQMAQYNLILLEKGFIENLGLIQLPDKSYRIHVIRKARPFDFDSE